MTLLTLAKHAAKVKLERKAITNAKHARGLYLPKMESAMNAPKDTLAKMESN